jgi:serine/threonine protein kinase/Flp pilus assembly protein TadD
MDGRRVEPPSGGLDVETRANQLAEEMADRWRQGEHLPAEEFLARHPELNNQPEAVLRLVYEEMCLRQEAGESIDPQTFLDRFPRFVAELRIVLDCHELLNAQTPAPRFPQVGEVVGEFRLLRELGQGSQSRVFLAVQPALADRLVALKVVPGHGAEHLSLARLQHTHIVPLYAVQDIPERQFRVLCMPYFGSLTLAQLLTSLLSQPPGQRTGRDVLAALEQASLRMSVGGWTTRGGQVHQFLARASYVQTVCWLAACLADGLQYAHERGLVHLDVKPSNVLLASDGTPMLLDFHLAREPLPAGDPPPDWLGGTRAYMAPEQRRAFEAVAQGQPVPATVDRRADVYALGVLLYEALGGPTPLPEPRPLLRRLNPQVSPALADLVERCLAADPARRYPDAAALANDLRRHLRNLPLRGVANRSLRERWQKWRWRRPYMLPVLALIAVAVVGVGLMVAHAGNDFLRARAALGEGQEQMRQGRWAEAIGTLKHGLALIEDFPGSEPLRDELGRQRRLAEESLVATETAEAVRLLHQATDQLRVLFAADVEPAPALSRLAAQCRQIWEQRAALKERLTSGAAANAAADVKADLLDLAILWTDLSVRLAAPDAVLRERQRAQEVLREAEELFGTSVVLTLARQEHATALGRQPSHGPVCCPRTAWEHHALGRTLLRAGELEQAGFHLARAVELQPQNFWFHFSRGLCAQRQGQAEEAVIAFTAAIALAPPPVLALCYVNRAQAYTARDRTDRALRDYNRALDLEPGLATAWLNRGLLHLQEQRSTDALEDLRQALACGADPATVHYNLALAHCARRDWAAAAESVRQALQHNPRHKDAQELQDRLRRPR